jgi:murein DD-endopeptidase MepM/ murein hydrolase activator NlpD
LRQVTAQIMADLFTRREAAQDRRQAARRARRRAARRAARQAALLAAQQTATGPSPVSSTTPTAAPDCPMHALGAMGRVDEGVDYAGAGPVYALGSGTVTLVDGASGWPGGMFIAYHLDSGEYVYLAEDVSSAVGVGQRVHPGTVIGNAYGGGDGIETGWAMPPGNIPEAAAYNHYTDGVPTQEGYDFRSALIGMGCA